MEKVRDIPVDGLYTLKKKDAYKASLVFAEAFYDYPLFKGIIPDDKRMEALSIMFDMDIRYAMRTGGAYALNEELEAVMTWQYHSVQKADIWGYFSAVTPRMFRLIFLLGFKCLNRLQEMFTEIQKQMDVLKVPPLVYEYSFCHEIEDNRVPANGKALKSAEKLQIQGILSIATQV